MSVACRHCCAACVCDVDTLRAENDLMRDALTQILDLDPPLGGVVRRIAEAALLADPGERDGQEEKP